MDYKVLYRKYRPSLFSEIVGQKFTVEMLKNAVINNRIAHAYIFTGPRGTGKTSTAKIFAKTINCLNPVNGESCGKCDSCLSFANSPDIIEIDAASNNGVDDIRELINNVKVAPTEGKYKVYIIDEVHMMTQSAFNALLLTLEEPPSHAIFIMATTNIESVPITILSRCQRFNFNKISMNDLEYQIKHVCECENIEIDNDAITEIASLSEGGMRDALSLLDQLSSNKGVINTDMIVANYGSISYSFINNLLGAINDNNLSLIHSLFGELNSSGADYKIFMKKFINVITNSLFDNKYPNLVTEQVKNIVFEFNNVFNDININVNPFMLLELIVINNIHYDDGPVVSIQQNDFVESKNDNFSNSDTDSHNIDDNIHETIISDDSDLVRIRVNNCFCGAKKNILMEFKEVWDDLRNNSDLNGEVKSFVLDTQVVASSGDYAILMTKLESTMHIINSKIKEFELAINDYLPEDVKLVALSEEKWNDEKNIYVNNIKKGYAYSFIQDIDDNDTKIEPNDSNIETNIFESDKIEIV